MSPATFVHTTKPTSCKKYEENKVKNVLKNNVSKNIKLVYSVQFFLSSSLLSKYCNIPKSK